MREAKDCPTSIRALRDSRGWTQAELARRVGVHPSAVAQWEKGWTEPRKVSLQALARVFNVSLTDMMSGVTRAEPRHEVVPGGSALSRDVDDPQPRFDISLLRQAAELGIDVVAELSPHLSALIRLKREERWLEENREALADANAFLDRYGLWSDGKRQF